MKNKKTLLSIVLVFAVLMGGAYVLYDRLGRNVGTEQMIVHADQQPAASAATEGDSADTAGKDESASEQEPEVVPAPDFTVYDGRQRSAPQPVFRETHCTEFLGKLVWPVSE